MDQYAHDTDFDAVIKWMGNSCSRYAVVNDGSFFSDDFVESFSIDFVCFKPGFSFLALTLNSFVTWRRPLGKSPSK